MELLTAIAIVAFVFIAGTVIKQRVKDTFVTTRLWELRKADWKRRHGQKR